MNNPALVSLFHRQAQLKQSFQPQEKTQQTSNLFAQEIRQLGKTPFKPHFKPENEEKQEKDDKNEMVEYLKIEVEKLKSELEKERNANKRITLITKHLGGETPEERGKKMRDAKEVKRIKALEKKISELKLKHGIAETNEKKAE